MDVNKIKCEAVNCIHLF